MELENIAILEDMIKQDRILSHPDVEGKQILVSPSFFNQLLKELEYLSGEIFTIDNNLTHYYKGYEIKPLKQHGR